MADIHLWGALRPAADGASVISVDARTIRELFRKLEDDYPGMSPHLARGVAGTAEMDSLAAEHLGHRAHQQAQPGQGLGGLLREPVPAPGWRRLPACDSRRWRRGCSGARGVRRTRPYR